jgi:hypothetical protein
VIYTPTRPTNGSTGVSINNAATWTNTTAVTLNIVWPQGASYVQVSNDGGMTTSTNFDVSPSIPWTLDSSQSASAQRSVYVRFLDNEGVDLAQNSSAFSDDIELDNVLPAITTVTAAADATGLVTVTYSVTDNVGGSGVKSVQVADAQDPTAIEAVPTTGVGTSLATGSAPVQNAIGTSIYLRVRDFAGNYSGWTSQTITLPPPPPATQTKDNPSNGTLTDSKSVSGTTGTGTFADGSTVAVAANGTISTGLKTGFIGNITGVITVAYRDPSTQVLSKWTCVVPKFGTTKKNPALKMLPKTKWFPVKIWKPAKGCTMPTAVMSAMRVSLIKITVALNFVRLYPTTGLAIIPKVAKGKNKIAVLKRTMNLTIGVQAAR